MNLTVLASGEPHFDVEKCAKNSGLPYCLAIGMIPVLVRLDDGSTFATNQMLICDPLQGCRREALLQDQDQTES